MLLNSVIDLLLRILMNNDLDFAVKDYGEEIDENSISGAADKD